MHPRIERIYKTWTRFGNLQHTLECAWTLNFNEQAGLLVARRPQAGQGL